MGVLSQKSQLSLSQNWKPQFPLTKKKGRATRVSGGSLATEAWAFIANDLPRAGAFNVIPDFLC